MSLIHFSPIIFIIIVAMISLLITCRGKKEEDILTNPTFIHDFINLSKREKNKMDKIYSRQIRKFQSMNMENRDKSILYKYYKKYQGALTAVKKDGSLSVGTFLLGVIILSIVLTFIFTFRIDIPIIKVANFVVLIFFFHSLLLYYASIHSVSKNLAVLDSVDILCSDIDTGIRKSISNNLELLPSETKGIFTAFVSNSRDVNTPVDLLLDDLNIRLGSLSTRFCDAALLYESTGDRVLLKRFEDIMADNSKIRVRYLRQIRIFKENSKYFFISALLVAGIIFMLISTMGLPFHYFTQGIPKLSLLLSFLVIIISYILAQIQYTKEDL